MRALLCLLLLAGPALAGAPAAMKDPIDAALDECLGTPDGESTRGMLDCSNTASTAWDMRLNERYQAAMTGLDPQSRDRLRTAQRAWLAFREAERALWGAPWTEGRGTLIQVEIAGARLEAIRHRARELWLYTGDQ